jgi:hypothetical protein
MRRVLVVSSVLGIGTALVFAAAALTATLFPNGTVVGGGWNGGMMVNKGGWGVAAPVPAPVVMPDVPPDAGTTVPEPSFQPLPGDTVGGDAGATFEVQPAP